MADIAVKKQASQETQPSFLAEAEKRIDQIRERAYQLFELRGGDFGQEVEDWLTAEREVDGFAQAEVTDGENACDVRVELPGFEAKDITVTAMPQALLVEAAAEHRTAPSGKGQPEAAFSEYCAQEVFRQIPLPQPAALDYVTATLDNGVLTIHAPHAGRLPAKPYPDGVQVAVA